VDFRAKNHMWHTAASPQIDSDHVRQVGDLRRIGNPPVAVQKIVRPIANRPQDAIPDAILPHITTNM
jgi:hypothetical protein